MHGLSQQTSIVNFDRFNWADVFVLDWKLAKKFYSGMFDWHFIDQFIDGEMVYSLACLEESANPPESTSVAGIAPKAEPLEEGTLGNWNTYVVVQSVDKVVEKAVESGGRVRMEPMDVGQAGRLAQCEDTRGIAFHLWQPMQHSGARIANVPGSLNWFELTTSDTQAATCFYGSVFGWKVEERSSGDIHYILFKLDNVPVGSVHSRVEETAGQELWTPYIRVESVDDSLAKCSRLNGSVVFGPVDEPGVGRYAVIADPGENMLGIAEFTPH